MKYMVRRTTRAAIVLVSVALLVPSISAQGTTVRAPSPDLAVVVVPEESAAPAWSQLVADAARIRLSALGFDAQVDALAPGTAAQPQQEAEDTGASAVIVCRFRVEGRQMVLDLGWYDPRKAAPTASSQARGDLDLRMDRLIFGALDDILGKVPNQVQAMSTRRVAARRTAHAAAQALPPAAAPAVPGGPVSASGPGGEAGTRALRPSSAGVSLLVSGGFAPFVPVGAASSYFTVGYLPSVLVSVLLPTRAGPVGIGFYTGMDYFSAVGLIDTSITYLVPLGLDLRYELDFGTLRPWFHLDAGPSLLVMVTGSQGNVLNAVFFLKSGIGLEYRITPWLGIAAVADYEIYFEMPYLIMGSLPR